MVKKQNKKANKKEDILLNIFHEEQDKKGYISIDFLKKISTKYNIPISRLYGVVKFYTMLRTEPQGKYIIELCGSPTCVLHESREIENFLKKELKIDIGDTTKDKMFSVYKTSCIGCCDEPPAMLLNGKPITNLTIEKVKKLIKELKSKKK
ncbi:MAG: NADH dehydrogenase subunit E [Candidatus Diapherotrites archaeon ADurb.Bin253]|jgi:NADH:ubiquinone oxidoreductase subunit E|nr:NAD(P)H-dependent oxidoreductase subunit E [Candidatus Pacearchaeota archaeon]OQA68225.1 MAG: NADH dehydrogenase subunit E [Candidatus Diapherotrites archaeon ADurb.Bin253]HNZ52292.1 NAD(P)H-dependent oxidoreductase subunit E [Candidatus Pacearchaeota archaeon]HOC96728.1 NAD(P)H-dependent oxidoreductase subunit E [Candidatus Pacearchaeota archaeon]HOF44252.1 NAD(P)H-dependent oxidoreductase subunit E [Candidatus Pacearchaeota archaeon]